MTYGELAHRLRANESAASVLALPDGSVDVRYRVRDDGERRFDSREAFGRAVASDRDSFALDRERTAPGGQAVNMARQVAALGDDVRLLGHLDDPAFDDLPFDATSMGDPGRVSVITFGSDDLMLAEDSRDVREWDATDLEAALPGGVEGAGAYDAVCCGNWVSMPGQDDALRAVASAATDGGTFVVDPGSVSSVPTERRRTLFETLARLSDAFDVVLSVNESELRVLAAAADADSAGTAAELDAVRRASGVESVVLHGADAATAATPDGTARVESVYVPRVATVTGAGDRFSAGLARARGAGWGWEASLALGNACASYFVASGQTASRDDLAAFVDSRA